MAEAAEMFMVTVAGYAIGTAIAMWADTHEAPFLAAAGVALAACCLVACLVAGALA